MKTVQQHLEDGTFQPCRHEGRLKNSEQFTFLDKLPAPRNKSLNEVGKKFYREYGKYGVDQGILTALDLPLLEHAAYLYQELKSCVDTMGGDVPGYLKRNKITVANALVSYYKGCQLQFIDVLKALGASPHMREKISSRAREPERKASILDLVK